MTCFWKNTWLKTEKTAPTAEFLSRKQEILPQLEESLSNLRKLKPEYFSPFDDSKKLVGQSHSKLLQIFYLDRENEELLVKLTQPDDRQSFNRFTTSPEEIEEIHDSYGGLDAKKFKGSPTTQRVTFLIMGTL